jgi:hypothetical protein
MNVEQETALETWIDMTCYPPSNGEYHEDALPTPSITVEEAYDLKLLELDVPLMDEFLPYGEEYSKRRKVVSIEVDKRFDDRFIVCCEGGYKSSGVKANETLYISIGRDNPTLIVMWGLWLKSRTEYWKLRDPQD